MVTGAFSKEIVQQIAIEGKLGWQGELRGRWFGGNAARLERYVNTPEVIKRNDALDRKLREDIIPAARGKDAYFVHFFFDSDTAQGGSIDAELAIESVESRCNPCDNAQRGALWAEAAKKVSKDVGPMGPPVKFEWEKTANTGGFPAYTGLFEVKYADRSAHYWIYHFVNRGGTMHLFRLSGDFATFDPRFAEFTELLSSVHYLP